MKVLWSYGCEINKTTKRPADYGLSLLKGIFSSKSHKYKNTIVKS